MMFFPCATIIGKPTHPSDLLDKESRALLVGKDLLHRETRRASSNDHLRGGISVISQALPGGLRRTICLGLAQTIEHAPSERVAFGASP